MVSLTSGCHHVPWFLPNCERGKGLALQKHFTMPGVFLDVARCFLRRQKWGYDLAERDASLFLHLLLHHISFLGVFLTLTLANKKYLTYRKSLESAETYLLVHVVSWNRIAAIQQFCWSQWKDTFLTFKQSAQSPHISANVRHPWPSSPTRHVEERFLSMVWTITKHACWQEMAPLTQIACLAFQLRRASKLRCLKLDLIRLKPQFRILCFITLFGESLEIFPGLLNACEVFMAINFSCCIKSEPVSTWSLVWTWPWMTQHGKKLKSWMQLMWRYTTLQDVCLMLAAPDFDFEKPSSWSRGTANPIPTWRQGRCSAPSSRSHPQWLTQPKPRPVATWTNPTSCDLRHLSCKSMWKIKTAVIR